MTAQSGENLHYEGKDYSMCSEPLNQYFTLSAVMPNFESPSTSLWRGYVGSWSIIENRLYLVNLTGFNKDGTESNLNALFPDYPDQVFAHWYCGTLRVPDGQMLHYEHMGYASTYERDILIEIEQGIVKEVNIKHNGESDNPDGPEGYGVAAFTTFARKKEVNDE